MLGPLVAVVIIKAAKEEVIKLSKRNKSADRLNNWVQQVQDFQATFIPCEHVLVLSYDKSNTYKIKVC